MPAPVIPPTLTPAGLSPDRADRATFVARSIARDDFIKNTQIPQLQTAITNVYNNSLEAFNSGVSATANAASSAINASQAAAASAATQWVSGTTYAVGDARWSPITKLSYRRIVAGAGTTDPSADTTNWAAIIIPIAGGGTGATNPSMARAGLEIPDMLARNVIINGACDIAQRGSLVVLNNTGGYGGPDRFSTGISAAGGQFTQSAQTLTFGGQVKASVRQTVDTVTTAFTTTNYWAGIAQNIEGLNCYYLKDKPFVVSFIFNTNLTGTYSVAVRDGAAGYSYVTAFSAVANTPVKVSVAIPVIPSAASIPRTNALGVSVSVGFLNQATYQTATLNSWLTGNFITASTQTIWAATAGNFIELTELQVEAGTVATPFERRSFGVELAMCQRYYEIKGFLILTVIAGRFQTGYWSVTKRASPTLVLVAGGTGGAVAQVPNGMETNAFYQSVVHSVDTTASVSGTSEL